MVKIAQKIIYISSLFLILNTYNLTNIYASEPDAETTKNIVSIEEIENTDIESSSSDDESKDGDIDITVSDENENSENVGIIVPESNSIGADMATSTKKDANGYSYIINSDRTVTITGYEGSSNDLIIPSREEGYPVKAIGPNAFNSKKNKGKLVIPEGIETIGDCAFFYCNGLYGDLIIPSSVKTIGNTAFRGCYQLNGKLVIPNGVETIGDHAFNGCNNIKGDLVIPGSVKVIGNEAFANMTGLNGRLVISNGVQVIGDYAFYADCELTGDIIIPESVTTIGKYAFHNCDGFDGKLVISNGVSSIGESAFQLCYGITGDLILPDSITSIGDNAFSSCVSLNGKLRIPQHLTTISNGAFSQCKKLSGDLIIPEGVTTIGSNAFYNCRELKGKLVIPDSVTSIQYSAFGYDEGLTGPLILPPGLTTIGGQAFELCKNLTGNLIIPDTVTSIGDGAFAACTGLSEKIYIPKGVASIADNSFCGCTGIKKIINESNQGFDILWVSDYRHTWRYQNTGQQIIYVDEFFKGVAVRDDYTGSYDDIFVDSISLSLGGDVALNIYMNFSDSASRVSYATINGQRVAIPSKESDGTYKFRIGIPAKNMNDKIAFAIYNNKGQVIPIENRYAKNGIFYISVRDYINSVKNKGDALASLANRLDTYGLYAQNYFEYEIPSSLPTVSSSAKPSLSYRKLLSKSLPSDVKYLGSTLVLNDAITIRHYFNGNIEKYSPTVNGKSASVIIRDGYKCIEISGVSPSVMYKTHKVVLKDFELTYCGYSYLYDAANANLDSNLLGLMRALYLYSEAAKQYFGS